MPDQDQSNLERALDLVPVPEDKTKGLSILTDSDEDKLPIDQSLTDVYERAMMAFEEQVNNAGIVEPRFAARNMEVAKMFLDSAIEALKLRNRQTEHKDKVILSNAKLGRVAGKTTNNILIADRNDILRKLFEDKPHKMKAVVEIEAEEELEMDLDPIEEKDK